MLETTRKAKIWLLTLALLFAVFKNGFGEGKAYAAGGDFAGGTGAQVDPYLIETADQLDKVRGSYLDTGTYFKLISDIDLGGYAAAGWNSIGDSVTPFYGHFDGDGHTISRLTNHNGDSLGLFGALSTGGWIGNLKLTDVSIVGDSLVGGLVGDNYQGTIDNVSVSGEITGVDWLGGLVGYSYDGTISNSCAAVKITGEKKVGGLIGEFMGEMNDSCATGEVSGDRNVGGLIGYAEEGQIQRSYASGKVYGTDEVGGLIGRIEEGDISYSYATGDVSGNMDVGGLIGTQIKVTTSYNHAAGNVSGDADCTSIGGLIGYSNDSKILFSYALGEVSGLEDSNNVGGLAGVNSYWSFGEISHSYALGNVDGGTNGFNVGGLVGVNMNGTISNSFASGDLNRNSGETGYYAGGLVGDNTYGTIQDSYASGTVRGNYIVGGLVGNNPSDLGGEIVRSFAIGDVEGGGIGSMNIGGLVGDNSWGKIVDSYAAGKVSGNDVVGGLAGGSDSAEIWTSYSYGEVTGSTNTGGFVGSGSSATIVNSFYDTEKSGLSISEGGAGLITAQMQSQSSYEADAVNAWDFTATWGIDPVMNGGYPYLKSSLVTLQYEDNDSTTGTAPASQSYVPVTEVGLPGAMDLVKTGHTFVGWNEKADGSGVGYSPGDSYKVRKNTSLYAQWIAVTLSSDATLISSIGTVSTNGSTAETITDVPYGTTLSTFKAAITPAANATFEVYEADGVTVATVLASNYKVIVTAEDGTTQVTYTITVDPAPPSSDATLTSSIGTVSTNGSAAETITDVPYGTTLSAFKAAITPAANATLEVYEADGVTVATSLASNYRVIVTAEDGTTQVTYTITVDPAPPSSDATVTSTIGTVSTNGSAAETITDVPYGTTLSVFKAAITPATNASLEVYEADGLTVATVLASNYKVIVTAEDGTTQVTYTVTVDPAPPSSDATLTSSIGTVSTNGTASETITAVPYGTTLSVFKVAITPATNATFEVYEADGVTVATVLASNYKVIVTAEDGTTQVTYTVTVDPAPPSSDATLTSSIGTVSTNGTASETITAVPYGTTLSVFKVAITPATNATFEVYEADGVTVATSLASGNKVIVTAQDGTTRVTYTVTVKSAPSNPTAGGNGGGSYTPPSNKLILQPGKSGELSLLGEITVTVPSDAFDKEVIITINRETDPQKLLSDHDVLLSSVFEVLKNFKDEFKNPVTITIKFNSAKLPAGQTPAIFLYDEAKKRWMEVPNGQVSGDRVSVKVRSLAKFAVFATQSPVDQETNKEPLVKLTDIAGHWAESSILQAVREGIVAGYSDGSFKPNRIVTRAEFALMLMNALKRTNQGGELLFSDASKIANWAKNAVALAVEAGYINGYRDGTFRPNSAITRAEMAIMVAKVLGLSPEKGISTDFKDDLALPAWAKGAIASIQAKEIMKGNPNGEFAPEAKATRAEAVTVLLKLLEAMGK